MKALDVTSTKFGTLTAISCEVIDKKRGWWCSCECGETKWFPTFQLTSGNAMTCGGDTHRQQVQPGDVFGKLTVVHSYKAINKRWSADCQCECGKGYTTSIRNLQRGTNHCGCAPDNSNRGKAVGIAAFNALVTTYRGNAKNKGLVFELSDEQCENLFKGPCFFCGAPPTREFTKKNVKGSYTFNGIDRTCSLGGYTHQNVKSCCTECNFLKGSRTDAEFLSRIAKIAEHQRMVHPRAPQT